MPPARPGCVESCATRFEPRGQCGDLVPADREIEPRCLRLLADLLARLVALGTRLADQRLRLGLLRASHSAGVERHRQLHADRVIRRRGAGAAVVAVA